MSLVEPEEEDDPSPVRADFHAGDDDVTVRRRECPTDAAVIRGNPWTRPVQHEVGKNAIEATLIDVGAAAPFDADGEDVQIAAVDDDLIGFVRERGSESSEGGFLGSLRERDGGDEDESGGEDAFLDVLLFQR